MGELSLLQSVWLEGVTNSDIGLTITEAVLIIPGQLSGLGVIVKVTITGKLMVLFNIPVISPDPLAEIPLATSVLSRVQVNVVPVEDPAKWIFAIGDPEQIDWVEGVAITSGGFTVIVKVIAVPVHVIPPLV